MHKDASSLLGTKQDDARRQYIERLKRISTSDVHAGATEALKLMRHYGLKQ